MTLRLVDSHCHLNHEDFSPDIGSVLSRADAAGVGRIICVGWDVPSSEKAAGQSKEIPGVYAAVGVHPHDADTLDKGAEERLKTLAAEGGRVVAIGETGLDYYRSTTPEEIQQHAFRRQIRLASGLNLPLIIHSREAGDDILQILKEEGVPAAGAVMHCFSGGTEFAKKVLDMGCYLGIAGQITFKNGEEAREVARFAPLDRLLIETDAPYLAPAPFRGRRNEPAYIVRTAERLAELRGIPLSQVAEATKENACKVFMLV
jgi:TatD DNase family protein